MDAIKQAGECMACLQLRGAGAHGHIECHHLLSGGRRRGHRYVIGLCVWHHRGDPHFSMTKTEMTEWLGPSLAGGSKPFHARFGTDDALLAMQDDRIGWTQEVAA
jgi:hypothetical protein